MKRIAKEPQLLSRDYLRGSETLFCSARALGEPYPLHAHEFFEIELITDGNGEQTLNGKTQPLSRGCLSFLTPTDLHAVTPRTPLSYYNVMFTELCLADSPVSAALLAASGRQLALDAGETATLEALFSALAEESSEKQGAYAEAAARALLDYILIRILRHKSDAEEKTHTDAVRAALFYLRRHFREPIALSDAAAAVHLSPHYFSTLFHAETGERFHSHLTRLRVEYAHRLLVSGSLPIMTVCYHAGFRSFSAFSREFRAAYGLSPSKVRGAAPSPF